MIVAGHCLCAPHRTEHERSDECRGHSPTSDASEIECLDAMLARARSLTYGVDRLLTEARDPRTHADARARLRERTYEQITELSSAVGLAVVLVLDEIAV